MPHLFALFVALVSMTVSYLPLAYAKGEGDISLLGRVVAWKIVNAAHASDRNGIEIYITGELRARDGREVKKSEVHDFKVFIYKSATLKTYVPRKIAGSSGVKYEPFMRTLKFEELLEMLEKVLANRNRIQIDVHSPGGYPETNEINVRAGMIFNHTALYEKLGQSSAGMPQTSPSISPSHSQRP